MKIETNFDTEKGMITLPTIAIGYHTKQHSFAIVIIFICWTFSIELNFK